MLPSSIGSPVTPADCALLVAVPLSEDEFVADVNAALTSDASQARGDYAFGLTTQGHGGKAEDAWRLDGSSVARLCVELVEEARSVGVKVIAERATLDTLGAATSPEISVLLLVAHWRDANISRHDLRPGLYPRVRAMARSPADKFESGLVQHFARVLGSDDSLDDRSISLGLRTFLQGRHYPDAAMLRDELDRRFADSLVPGNCLELRDGFHKAIPVANTIQSSWSGTVELCVCQSIGLATAIKRSGANRFVITNERQKQPVRCLREMRETLLRLSTKAVPYARLRARVFGDYSKLLLES